MRVKHIVPVKALNKYNVSTSEETCHQSPSRLQMCCYILYLRQFRCIRRPGSVEEKWRREYSQDGMVGEECQE